MRIVEANTITHAVKQLCLDAGYNLPQDVFEKLEEAHKTEKSPLGKSILADIIENAKIARTGHAPICQDTGMVIVFVEIGQDVHVQGNFEDAINEGVRQGYTDGYLRKSMVAEPLFERRNTKDNTPAIIHTRLVTGDKISIRLAPKGAGSENKSALKMLVPSDGIAGVKKFILETVQIAGPNVCPPMVVGVGIGGTMEMAAIYAKKACMRDINTKNTDPRFATLEEELLTLINKTGIGPQGLGGTVTALKVHVEWYPTHIATLPVAVNINCHATRHAHVTI